MSDFEHIAKILALITELWGLHPDWRLGQLLVNVTGNSGDMFYMSDAKLEDDLKTFLEWNWNQILQKAIDNSEK